MAVRSRILLHSRHAAGYPREPIPRKDSECGYGVETCKFRRHFSRKQPKGFSACLGSTVSRKQPIAPWLRHPAVPPRRFLAAGPIASFRIRPTFATMESWQKFERFAGSSCGPLHSGANLRKQRGRVHGTCSRLHSHTLASATVRTRSGASADHPWPTRSNMLNAAISEADTHAKWLFPHLQASEGHLGIAIEITVARAGARTEGSRSGPTFRCERRSSSQGN